LLLAKNIHFNFSDVPELTSAVAENKSKWCVYLSKNKPTRHVTVIPINNNHSIEIESKPPCSGLAPPQTLDKEEGIQLILFDLPIGI